MPTHLLTKWNNQWESKQRQSGNLFYSEEKAERRQREKSSVLLAQHEVSISCLCHRALFTSEKKQGMIRHCHHKTTRTAS